MTIQQLFRAACSGACGRWLLVMNEDAPLYSSVSYPDNATAFPSHAMASRAVAAAGWNRGHCPKCSRKQGTDTA